MLKLVSVVAIVSVSLFAVSPVRSEDNKAIVRRYYAEVLTKGNVAAIDDLVSPTYIGHDPAAPEAQGTAGLKQRVTRLRTAFPDLQVTVEDMVAEGNKVATRFTLQGTHKGEFRGIAPTGEHVTWTATSIIRLENGSLPKAGPMRMTWDGCGSLERFPNSADQKKTEGKHCLTLPCT